MSDNSKEQARAQLSSIYEMVAALHCDYERLEKLRGFYDAYTEKLAENCDELDRLVSESPDSDPKPLKDAIDHIRDHLMELADLEQEAGGFSGREEVSERIYEEPLELCVRSGWCQPAGDKLPAQEYMILLCTGGPAVRIIGDLNQYSEPVSARIEHQDWFEPWTDMPLNREEEDTVLDYCSQFYFGG